MVGEKEKFDQLARESLNDAKGGIPYEKPELLEFTLDGTFHCAAGIHCTSGGTDCLSGRTCSTGVHDPAIIPPK